MTSVAASLLWAKGQMYLSLPPLKELSTPEENMALKFAANLSFTFLEHGNFLDRYQAAKNAGMFFITVYSILENSAVIYVEFISILIMEE